MKILFNKNVAVYIFSGLAICIFATLFFIYSQLRDVDNFKSIMVEKIEKLTGRKVSIEQAEIKFEKGLSVRLKQLSISSPNGRGQDFLAKNAWCVIKLWPLLNREIKVKKIILDGAFLELVRDKQGKFNVGDPFSLLTEQNSSRLFKVLGASLIHRLSVLDSEVRFRDYYDLSGSEPISTLIDSIDLTTNKRVFKNDLSLNLSGNIPNKYQDTVFEFLGAIDSFRNLKRHEPIPIRGKIKLAHLYLDQLRPYLKNALPAVPDDTKLTLQTDISGNIGRALFAKGELQYSGNTMGQNPALSTIDSLGEGEIEYALQLDKNSIEIQNLKATSGQSSFSANGKFINYQTKDPRLSFTIQSDEFKIAEHRNFPLLFFPESLHKKISKYFNNGTLGIKSLEFEGSLDQLQNLNSDVNKDRITTEIYFREIDWRSPLPLLKAVTGSFGYKNGDGFIEIMKARYEDFPLSNIKGTVKNIINKPLLDLSMKSELDLGKLNLFLKKSIEGQSFENIIDDYQEVEGNGLLEAKLQGPPDDKEKTSMTAVLSKKRFFF